MFRKLLPKHSPAVRSPDYRLYLFDRVRRPRRRPTLTEVWGPHLPDRVLLGTPSGRYALWDFLEIERLPEGSEVLVAAYNFHVVVRILMQKGLVPVFVDIERDTLGMDPDDLRRKISPLSSLVVVTHMFGIPADVATISHICEEVHLPLFEDCAHGVGTVANGRHIGQFGAGALFSFGPFKSVTCFGGGMLALAPRYARRSLGGGPVDVGPTVRWRIFGNMLVAALLTPRLYGWSLYPFTRLARRLAERGVPALRDVIEPVKRGDAYHFDVRSYPPFRDFMREVLSSQLGRLEQDVDRRRGVIAAVKGALRSNPEFSFLDEDRHGHANGSYFGLYVTDAAAFTVHMLRSGVQVDPNEFYDCSRLEQFSDHAASCPRAAYASDHLVRLPSYTKLNARETAHISVAANAFRL